MSRKRRQKSQQNVKKSGNVQRHFVPLQEWQRFQEFRQQFGSVESAVKSLKEDWESHCTYLLEALDCIPDDYEEMKKSIGKVVNFFERICRSKKNQKCQIAEITIEDISDGKL